MNLQDAPCQGLSFNNELQAVVSPLSTFCIPLSYVLTHPHVLSGACVLCSARNMRGKLKWFRQPLRLLSRSHDGVSWIPVRSVELRCCDSFCLPHCHHVCSQMCKWRRGEVAHRRYWFISFLGLWLWLLMDSPEVWQLSTGLAGISTKSINEAFQTTAPHWYYWLEGKVPTRHWDRHRCSPQCFNYSK